MNARKAGGDVASTSPAVAFRTTLKLHCKTATGLEIPDELLEQLAHGKRPSVKVTINQYTYRSTVGRMRGRYLVPVSAANRGAAHVKPGDPIDVVLTLDPEPRRKPRY